jgi:hypothetical protein
MDSFANQNRPGRLAASGPKTAFSRHAIIKQSPPLSKRPDEARRGSIFLPAGIFMPSVCFSAPSGADAISIPIMASKPSRHSATDACKSNLMPA